MKNTDVLLLSKSLLSLASPKAALAKVNVNAQDLERGAVQVNEVVILQQTCTCEFGVVL